MHPATAPAALLIAGIAAFAGPAAAQSCQTQVPTSVAPGAIWTKAGSPYCIAADTTIPLLTIKPGVEVWIDPGVKVSVLGTIDVQGSAAEPVLFTCSDPTQRWTGFRFDNTPPGSAFRHAIIERAGEGAVRIANGVNPLFEDCLFRDNRAIASGGALQASGSTGPLSVVRCRFEGNQATENGGALRIDLPAGERFDCRGSEFVGNTANPDYASGSRVGGAFYLSSGDADVRHCVFDGNRANSRCVNSFDCSVTARGGAVHLAGDGARTFELCEFYGNVADARNNGNCFFGGSSYARGAALYVDAGTCDVRNSVFACGVCTASGSGCGPSYAGSGVYVAGGTVTIDHCTVARNDTKLATGIHRAGGSLTVVNSVVWGNNGGGTEVGGTATLTYSCVEGSQTGVGVTNFNPVFAGAGCSRHDLTVVIPSACIDGGDPASAPDACYTPSWSNGPGHVPDIGHNGGPLACEWAAGLTSSPPSPVDLSLAAGGTQNLLLEPGPQFEGDTFIVLGSVSGFAPGFALDELHVPLQPDAYFDLTAAVSAAMPLIGSFGTLGPVGAGPQAQADFVLGAGAYPPALAGIHVYHSFLVIRVTPTLIDLVFSSNAVVTRLI